MFEKLNLKWKLQTEALNSGVITGKHQHGFKCNKSTSTLTLQLQSLVARALDGDNYVTLVSLDLSAAFDVVNIDLLLARLMILGLPDNILSLVEIWLKKAVLCSSIRSHLKFQWNKFRNNPRVRLGNNFICHLRRTHLWNFKIIKLFRWQFYDHTKQI